MESVLLEFPHGVGDCVQLTAVLRHLRVHRPNWEIDVWVGAGRASLFNGLCRRAYTSAPDREYDQRFRLPFHEAPNETKTALCLRKYFGLEPSPELMAYEIKLQADDLAAADAYYRGTLGLVPDSSGRFPVVFAHYKGFSQPSRKNLPDAAMLPLAYWCRVHDLRLVVLDFDGKTAPEVANHPAVTVLSDRAYMDGARIAALTELATAWVGIDSGPGHIGGACTTPGVVVWTMHHPVRFYDWSMPHVLHLVPPNIDRLPPRFPSNLDRPRSRPVGRAVLDQHYRHAIYRDLGADLTAHVAGLAKLSPVPGNPMEDRHTAKLKATNFHEEYYEEHKAAGLDYLGHGKWQEDYGRWVVGSLDWSGGDVLDIGCACGSVAMGLKKAGCSPHGVDLNNHMISLGRTRFPGVPLYVCDAVNLHLFGADSFVGVHHNQVAEHWREELVPFILRELWRVLKPGGTVFGVFDTPELFARQNRKGEAEDPTNRCIRSLTWWRDQYQSAGFEDAPELAAALAAHKGNFLRFYDWDWLVVRKP